MGNKKTSLVLAILSIVSQSLLYAQSLTSTQQILEHWPSIIDVLDRWFEQSASTTYGTLFLMRLARDPENFSLRKAHLELGTGYPPHAADTAYAIIHGGPAEKSLSTEASEFARAVRQRLGIPWELACDLVAEPVRSQTPPLRQDQLLLFESEFLLVDAEGAPGVTQLLQRPTPPQVVWSDSEMLYETILDRSLDQILPGDFWLAMVADDVAGYLLSCSGPLAQETQLLFLRAILQMAESDLELGRETRLTQEKYESQECSLYPVNKIDAVPFACRRPRLCLALSGGGVRSAAFQVGVIQGLYDQGLLSQVDIISAVSGGAYATGWFINQRLLERSSPEVPAYSFLRDSNLRNTDQARSQLVTTGEGVTAAIAGLLAIPLEAIRDYLAKFAPGKPTFFVEHHLYRKLLSKALASPSMNLAELGSELRRTPDLPFPIFAATAHKGPCLAKQALPVMGDAANLKRNVFEFSPLNVGSEGLRFNPDARLLFTVADVVTISGAAIDAVGGPSCSALRAAQIRLGARFNGDLLTDGGFSDNLALFPLVKRACDAIIISDAEYDPEMVFGSYQRLKAALASQTPARILNIRELDDQVARTTRFCEQNLRQDRKQQCFVAPISPRKNGSAARAQTSSWFLGSLSGVDLDRVPVIYLKLALNEQDGKITEWSTIRAALQWRCPIKNCSFPQIPTKLQHLPPHIGAALRELGRRILLDAMIHNSWAPEEPLGANVSD